MLTILAGPIALILWPLLIVVVALCLHKQGWCIVGSVLGGLFTEAGLFVLCVMGVANKLNDRPFLGKGK